MVEITPEYIAKLGFRVATAWFIVSVALVMIFILLGTPYRFGPNFVDYIMNVLIIIGLLPLLILGAIVSYRFYKYDIKWRVMFWGFLNLVIVEIAQSITLIHNPSEGIGGYAYYLCVDGGLVFSTYFIFSGIILTIDDYFATPSGGRGTFKVLAIFIWILVVIYLYPIYLLPLGYLPVLRLDTFTRIDMVLSLLGWAVTIGLAYELLVRMKYSIVPFVPLFALLSVAFMNTFFFVDLTEEYYYQSTFVKLTLSMIKFSLALISLLLVIYSILISNFVLSTAIRHLGSSEAPSRSRTVLIEYSVENVYRTRISLQTLLNRIINLSKGINVLIHVTYTGSPLLLYISELASYNGLEYAPLFISRGIGYPRYDSVLKGYISAFDPNLIRLFYRNMTKDRRAMIIIDNLSHFILLYDVEKVYNVLVELIRTINEKDIIVMLLNREVHTRRELAYMRNLAETVIGFR